MAGVTPEAHVQAQAPPRGRPRRPFTAGWLLLALLGVLLLMLSYGYRLVTYPSDKTPNGAYLRVVRAVNQMQPAAFFAYTEEAAQHACFSIRDYRKQSVELVKAHFPADKAQEIEAKYINFAQAADGADVFALMADKYGWLHQLRKDMSGIARIDVSGPRATIQTFKGTRYAFRKRPGGIWGLTAFTPALVEEAEKAARDFKQFEKSAADYDRAQRAD